MISGVEEKAKILVNETKKFYMETMFIIGLAIYFIIRRALLGNTMLIWLM
jgi:hypothetical protein